MTPSTERSSASWRDWPLSERLSFLDRLKRPAKPSDLAARAVPGWRFPAHLAALESFCLRLIDDPSFNRAVVEVPVRHGKSWYCSWVFPAWYLLRYPHNKVILA